MTRDTTKTIVLSDGSTWEYVQDEFEWIGFYGAGVGLQANQPERFDYGVLTASDHRKIADVLDPPTHTGSQPVAWGVTQTITGDKDGNCLEAAIATVLGCALTDVPKLTDHTWTTQLTTWLSARGVSWTTNDAANPPAGLSIAVGPSPRRTVSHAVVAVNGKLAFDPHPDRTFFGDGLPKYFIELELHHPAAIAAARTPSPEGGTRDWIEDAKHENGNYECHCIRCGQSFIGHKRRVTCKLCASPVMFLP